MATCLEINPKFQESTQSELRLLTEVSHFVDNRRLDGTYPEDVQQGVFENLVSKVKEDAMSRAVHTSYQPAAEVRASNEQKRRTFLWKGLGQTALQVAESGYKYHTTEAAFKRVAVEVAEAKRSETYLEPGVVQCFISPRMSEADAPPEVAKKEHLAADDAIRVCYAVTDAEGKVIGRRMQSLLVRNIPLTAWVRMLKDPRNIFGKEIAIEDETSALSVMKQFEQLDLLQAAIPEGPISLVEAVVPYINASDAEAKRSVEHQIAAFREDQLSLHAEAERTARQWIKFEMSLADSLFTGTIQHEVQQFVVMLQSQWSKITRQLLRQHTRIDNSYSMSGELAAHLEQAWQKVYLGEAAIAVSDERSLQAVDKHTAEWLKSEAQHIRALQSAGMDSMEIRQRWSQHLLQVSNVSVVTGRGCSGENLFAFESQAESDATKRDAEDEGIGEVHVGVCRTVGCPSRPNKTVVGGCDVCLHTCQRLWDAGIDPATVYGVGKGKETAVSSPSPVPLHIFRERRQEVQEHSKKSEQRTGGLALAAAMAA